MTAHLRTAGVLLSAATLAAVQTSCGGSGVDHYWAFVPPPAYGSSNGSSPPPPPPPAYASTCNDGRPAFETIGPFRTYAGDCLLSYQLDESELRLLTTYDDALTTSVHGKVVEAFRSRFRDEFDYVLLLWDVDDIPDEAPVGMFTRAVDGRDDRCTAVIRTDCPRFLGTLAITFSLHGTPGTDALNGGPLLHEMAHAIGNFVLPTTRPSHWGHAGVGGQLGGWNPGSLKDVGGGQYQVDPFGEYANDGNSIPYAPLELYLMGLLPPADVPPVKVANDLQWIDREKGTFTASSFSTYTIGQIGEMLGEMPGDKRPDMAFARTSFRIATIVLTPEAKLADDKARHLSMGAGYFSHTEPLTSYALSTNSAYRLEVLNFRAATRSRAEVRMAGVSSFVK